MIKTIRTTLRRLLGLDRNEAKPTGQKSESVSKRGAGTPRKSASSRRSRPGNAAPAERRPRREKASRRSEESAAPPEASPAAPPVPPPLREVAPCEGKTRFLDLPLRPEIQAGIQASGFEYCTPIQALTLPALLEKRDLAGKAQTGTGKTAAFLLASFNELLNRPRENAPKGTPRMVVLAPTRELAMQIHKDALGLGYYTGLNIVVVFGGMDYDKQRRSLEAPIDLLIGTPGRVIDYSRNGFLDLSKAEILVIDEADRMLDMGFIPDVKRIVGKLPRKGERQTLLFSATLDESILRLASGWLADPVVIESEPDRLVGDNIEQTFYSVLREDKLALLLHLLRTREYDRVLIFGNRKDVNLKLQYDLARYGFQVPVLSGDIPQEKRIRILEKFRTSEEKIVIATDVAARGIHVDDVSMVINYDLPERAEDYVHRIGRTGRAGHTGLAVSFLCEYGAYYLPAIEEMLKTTFPSIQPTEEMLVLPPEVKGAKLPELPRRHSAPRRSGGFGHSAHRR